MSLATPDKIQTLQRKLCLKAKRVAHKHEVGSRGECRYPAKYIFGALGRHQSHRLACDSRTLPERTWSESRMREIRTSGSMSGDGKRNYGKPD